MLYINVSDRSCPFPFNILHTESEIERTSLVDEFTSVMKRLSLSWGEQIAHQMRMAINVILDTGGSLQDVYDLFTSSEARHHILRGIKDRELLEYWTETFPAMRYDRRLAVITKLAPIVEHPFLGPILCARECAFNADEIIKERKIVIVNMASRGSPSPD